MSIYGQSILRVIQSEIRISTPVASRQPVKDRDGVVAIWDTGATNSCISARVVGDLGLSPVGMRLVRTADKEEPKPVFIVDFHLPLMSKSLFGLSVTLCDLGPDVDALIGMDVITAGDFIITNQNGKTTMSFRIPSCSTVDYVSQTNFVRSVTSKMTPSNLTPKARKAKKKH